MFLVLLTVLPAQRRISGMYRQSRRDYQGLEKNLRLVVTELSSKAGRALTHELERLILPHLAR